MSARPKIKTLVVDDSGVFRRMLAAALQRQPDVEVVGAARDVFEARDMILRHHPDVIVLDIELPKVSGLSFLKTLRTHYPVPVIVCSGTTARDGPRAIQAIEAGALDVVIKPDRGGAAAIEALAVELGQTIRMAATQARPVPKSAPNAPAAGSFRAAGVDPNRMIVAIGASTGGTEAIRALLECCPPDFPPVAIVQHMPAGFTRSFAARLDALSRLTVAEATDGQRLAPGVAVVARGDTHMIVERSAAAWRVRYTDQVPVNRHCPSVEPLFESVAEAAGSRGVGVLLTGMGADGALGLLRMRQAGALTIAQSRETCVVYGMPRAAIDMEAAALSAAPADIPGLILRAALAIQSRAAVTIGAPPPA